MDKERLIRIKWDGPYDLEQAKCLSGKEDYGMYQIYGRHVIFGKDSLLYIGKAVDQSFSKRLKDHEYWLRDVSGLEIYVGRIYDEDYEDDNDWGSLVPQCESLLIYWHSPPYNSQHINTHTANNIKIHNHGELASLLHEISTAYEKKMPKQ